jgi:hypothetical protein
MVLGLSNGHAAQTSPQGAPKLKQQQVENLEENPLERTWRGDKEGKIRLQGVPDFKGDKYTEREWVKVRVAAWGDKSYVPYSFPLT